MRRSGVFFPDNISFLFSTIYDCSGARGEAVSTLRCMKLVDHSELEPYQFFLESGIWFWNINADLKGICS